MFFSTGVFRNRAQPFQYTINEMEMVVLMKSALKNFYSREMFVNNETATIDTNEKRFSANKQQRCKTPVKN